MFRSATSPDHSGLLARALDWVKRQATPGDDLSGLSQAELGHMADDLGISRSDVVALSAHAADNTALMEGMMDARGLDTAVIQNEFPTLLRDIERVCTRCPDAKRCRRELDAGTAAQHAHQFCPNAGTFDDLEVRANGPLIRPAAAVIRMACGNGLRAEQLFRQQRAHQQMRPGQVAERQHMVGTRDDGTHPVLRHRR